MEEVREDRRVVKTKRMLRAALAKLMAEKSVNRITVRELTDIVDINRATFYAHYTDIYDLVEQTEKEIYENLQELLNQHALDYDGIDIRPLLRALFQFIANDAEMGFALLCRHGDVAFFQRIQALVGDYFKAQWQRFNSDADSRWRQPFIFVLSGCTGMMQYWLEHGMQETPEELADLCAHLVRNGLVNTVLERRAAEEKEKNGI